MERMNELNQFNRENMSPFSKRARKLLGRAFSAGVDPFEINGVMSHAIENACLQGKGLVTRGAIRSIFDAQLASRLDSAKQPDSARFTLRKFDLVMRTPEKSEIFEGDEAQTYIDGCDYPESADDLLLALEMQQRFGVEAIRSMSILDAMCGPGRLGRELLILGAQNVVFHDGAEIMTAHSRNKALGVLQPGQSTNIVTSPVDNIPLNDNTFDLVVCHNATHQLTDRGRLRIAMRELLRITASGGHIVIADFQRINGPDFLKRLEERLQFTRPEIIPLLIPSFIAAFSKAEFRSILRSIPGIKHWSVIDAHLPILTAQMQEVVDRDHIKGHVMDFSPISQRVIVQKK